MGEYKFQLYNLKIIFLEELKSYYRKIEYIGKTQLSIKQSLAKALEVQFLLPPQIDLQCNGSTLPFDGSNPSSNLGRSSKNIMFFNKKTYNI